MQSSRKTKRWRGNGPPICKMLPQGKGWKVRPRRDVVVGFKPWYRFFRAGDAVYVQSTFVQRMDFIAYIVMSLGCIRCLCLTPENSACFQRWWCYPVNGVLLITPMVKYAQQGFSWAGIWHPSLPTDSFSNMLQKCFHFIFLLQDGNDRNRLNKSRNKFWMCLIL